MTKIDGYFETTGVVGLGPQRKYDDESIVQELAANGVIDEPLIGLNFEDPMDPDLVSSITFGFLEEGRVRDGKQGLNWFENVGEDSWAINVLTPLTYDGVELQPGASAKIAHIDTGSKNIRVPKAEYETLLEAMQKSDPTIERYEEEKWEGNIMKSRKSCD